MTANLIREKNLQIHQLLLIKNQPKGYLNLRVGMLLIHGPRAAYVAGLKRS